MISGSILTCGLTEAGAGAGIPELGCLTRLGRSQTRQTETGKWRESTHVGGCKALAVAWRGYAEGQTSREQFY